MGFFAQLLGLPTLVRPHQDSKAVETRRSIKAGDWQTLAQFASELRRRHHGDRDFYLQALTMEFADRPAAFDRWKDNDAGNPDAWLFSGSQWVEWAWHARSGARASDVNSDQFQLFFDRLAQANTELAKATGISQPAQDADIAWSRLRAAVGLQLPESEAREYFDAGIADQPNHFSLHWAMMNYLCAKWHGSHEQMFAFSREAAAGAAAGSDVPAILALAHVEFWLHAGYQNEMQNPDDHWNKDQVREEVLDCYQRSLADQAYQSNGRTPQVRNIFAYCLARTGHRQEAAKEFEQLGGTYEQIPWCYHPFGNWMYRKLQKRVRAS